MFPRRLGRLHRAGHDRDRDLGPRGRVQARRAGLEQDRGHARHARRGLRIDASRRSCFTCWRVRGSSFYKLRYQLPAGLSCTIPFALGARVGGSEGRVNIDRVIARPRSLAVIGSRDLDPHRRDLEQSARLRRLATSLRLCTLRVLFLRLSHCAHHLIRTRKPTFDSARAHLRTSNSEAPVPRRRTAQRRPMHPVPPSPPIELSTPVLTSQLDPIRTSAGPRSVFTNWASTYSSQTTATFRPRSVDEVRLVVELARRQGKELRASGSGHSPSDLVCTDGFVVNLDAVCDVIEVRPFCLVPLHGGLFLGVGEASGASGGRGGRQTTTQDAHVPESCDWARGPRPRRPRRLRTNSPSSAYSY